MVWAFLWILFQIILEKMGVSSAPACQLSSLSLLLHLCRWLHGWWHCLLLARKWFCCHRDGGARIASVHHYWAEAGQQGSGLHHRWVCDEGLWWNVQTFCWSTSMWLFLWFRCWGTNLGSRLQLRVLFHWKRGILAHQVCFFFLAASLQRLMGSFFLLQLFPVLSQNTNWAQNRTFLEGFQPLPYFYAVCNWLSKLM